MASRSAEDYRQLARDCHKIAASSTRNNRTALLEMAREWDRLADQPRERHRFSQEGSGRVKAEAHFCRENILLERPER
jgi:hypothetical protein